MTRVIKNCCEAELHDESRGRTLVIGRAAFEKLKWPCLAARVVVVDPQLPPTACHRVSSTEVVCGGLQFATELAGDDAVFYKTTPPQDATTSRY
jgi:hypothetical protein